MSPERYKPAAGRRGLTGLYDPVMALTMRERRFRGALVAHAITRSANVIVDLGCGTGTLTIQLGRAAPNARVMGLDADPDALRRAAEKARRRRLIDPRLLHSRQTMGANVLSLLSTAVMCNLFFFIALYLQLILGYGTIASGAAHRSSPACSTRLA